MLAWDLVAEILCFVIKNTDFCSYDVWLPPAWWDSFWRHLEEFCFVFWLCQLSFQGFPIAMTHIWKQLEASDYRLRPRLNPDGDSPALAGSRVSHSTWRYADTLAVLSYMFHLCEERPKSSYQKNLWEKNLWGSSSGLKASLAFLI
jgi:hypothetical protein